MTEIKLGKLEYSISYLLRLAYRNSVKLVTPTLLSHNFQGSELTMLLVIMENPNCNLSLIAQAVAVELPVAQRITNTLIEKGFAISQKSKEDKRATLYQVNELGKSQAEKALLECDNIEKVIFSGMTPAQLRSLTHSLQIISGVKSK